MTDEGRGGRGRAGGDGRNSRSGYGHSGGGRSGGFHRGGQGQGHGGYRGHGSDGGRSNGHGYDHPDARRGGQRFDHGNSDGRPRRDDRRGYRGHDDRRGGYTPYDHDNRRKQYGERDSDDRRGGFRRDDRGGNDHGRYQGHGDDRRGGYKRYDRDDRRQSYGNRGRDDGRGGFRRDDRRGDDHGYRDGGRDRSYGDRRQGGQGHGYDRSRDQQHGERRSGWQNRRDSGSDRRQDRRFERSGRDHFQDGPRRNSDGTVSYPSQNPYTDPRPDEPKMPKGLEWSMLSKDDKVRLRGLSKEHAENTGLHILAAYALEESDPERALAHAKWVAKQASRVDIARETLALVAYRQGDYKLALKEFRTAYRMNGYTDYLPFIADCERGLGHPRKAVEEATSEAAKELRGESKAEMFLVYAGALGDLGLWDKAIETVRALARAKGLSGDYLMRALQAEQNFLEQIGRADESHKLDPVLDRLEAEYAESDEDEEEQEIIVDNDLEHATASMLEDLDIPLYGGEDEAEDGQASNQEDSPETLGQAEPDQDDTARASAAESAGSTSEPDAEQPDDQATDGAAVDAAESAVSESPRVPAAPDQSASEPGAEPEPPSETNIPAAESGEDWTQEDQA